MDALELIDKMEELISKSRKIPFSSNFIINENEIYEILDELKSVIPEEFKQARWIVKERENMLEEAKRQAVKIIKDAEEKAENMLSENEIMKK
ncbi:MAG: ATPase, partial [Actinobacteria bacterium]|nr:ATPase [Actinomycetota bacterium]